MAYFSIFQQKPKKQRLSEPELQSEEPVLENLAEPALLDQPVASGSAHDIEEGLQESGDGHKSGSEEELERFGESGSDDELQQSDQSPYEEMCSFFELVRTARVRNENRNFYRCRVCYENKDLAAVKSYRGKLDKYCKEEGGEKRTRDWKNHVESTRHMECLRYKEVAALTPAQRKDINPFTSYIEKRDLVLGIHCAELMNIVYGDAKRGTLSAWSFPARMVAYEMGVAADPTKEFSPFEPKSGLQYCNPPGHRKFLSCIVRQDIPKIEAELESCLAVSIRVDGSVDRFQLDNEFVMAKVVRQDGSDRLIFLGFSQATKKGAKGCLGAVERSVERITPWKTLFRNVSSITTDGENMNTGDKAGLWALLRRQRADSAQKDPPLLTIWCAAHRTDLAFEDLENRVPEIHRLITDCADLSSFFHQSAMRTQDLSALAAQREFPLKRLRTYFDVRFAQFSQGLLEAVLVSWRALVAYFVSATQDRTGAAQCQGFLRLLTSTDHLLTMAFVCDVLHLFTIFQKKCQSDSLTLDELDRNAAQMRDDLSDLKEPLLGGWEEKVVERMAENEEDEVRVHGQLMWTRKGGRPNKNVSIMRPFKIVRAEIVALLCSFFNDRMSIDASLLKSLQPLSKLRTDYSNEDIKVCHSAIASDMDLRQFAIAYKDFARNNLTGTTIRQNLQSALQNSEWKPVAVVLARVIAATPHSCDVERLISAYNRVKTIDRSSLGSETLNDYLHVIVNMPVLSQYNVWSAVKLWLTEKDRRDAKLPPQKKSEWDVGVFEEAQQECKETDSSTAKIQF